MGVRDWSNESQTHTQICILESQLELKDKEIERLNNENERLRKLIEALHGIKENINTPSCFPTNKPNKIPKGTGFRKEFKLIPWSETPAFANANKGIIPKATYGLIECSILINSEKSFSFFLWGMAIANNTPAIVACTPELYVKNHKTKPKAK